MNDDERLAQQKGQLTNPLPDEKVERYWHAEHCGAHMDVKTSGTAEAQGRSKDLDSAPCLVCHEQAEVREVTRFEHERYTAMEDDCKNCGDVIVFLPDMLEWRHHEGDEVEVTEPVYGLRTCEAAMTRLMGLPFGTPLPEYQGQVAEPAGTHVNLDLETGDELANKDAAVELERQALHSKIADERATKAAMLKLADESFRRSLG